MNKIANFSIRHPWIVISVFLIITVFFALQIPKVQMDPSLEGLVPEDMPSRVNLDKIEDVFGGTDALMIILETDDILNAETLVRAQQLSDELESWEEVDKVNSPFTVQDVRGEEDMLIVEDAIEDIPQSSAQREVIRERIKNNELIYGSIISKDFKAMAIIGMLKDDVSDNLILDKVKKLIKDIPGKEKIKLAGMPVIRAEVSINTQNDMRRLMPLALLIMLVFLYLCFKQLRGVLLPFMVVVMSIVISMGMIPVLNWKIYLITVILPMSLIAIANDYGIHIIAHYQEENTLKSNLSEKKLVGKVVSSLGAPIIAAGLTTIAGMLCLISHIMVPAQELGILAAVGIGFALIASITFMPAVMVLLPKAKPLKTTVEGKKGLLERLLDFTANFVTANPGKIAILSIVFIALISSGIFYLRVDTNPVNYFKDDSRVTKATNAGNRYFGGANTISIMAEGDITAPEVMKKISDFEEKIIKHESVGDVGAISKIMRKMNKELHNGDEEFSIIPDNKNALPQYFMLYESSGDLKKLVDFDRKHALITAKIPTNSTDDIKGLVEYMRDYIKKDEESPLKIVGGFGDLQSELSEAVVKGQVISLITAAIVVGIIVMLLFKSPVAGLMSITPLALAIVTLFGLMGFFKIELNIATALLSSVMIGVGVDYTIHFLWRYREEKKLKDTVEAVKKTLKTTGRGIIFNALSVVIGFVALMISDFLPVKFFGFLVVVSIGACLLGALVFLPAICIIFKPKFLEVQDKERNQGDSLTKL
ncbi:MMPL family transporter [Halocella sp. SP3-1]|uniref:efflux RND transporter permease subunit n=1 Tax=Halocella sp. SP3-1 TaxID=2382161 RepID=UPI002570B55B|nr:MMPL family transporter [Halocella sp. SP3-1]